MTLLQQMTGTINASEVLWFGAVSVFGGVMLWLGRAIIETRDKVRQLVQTMYGPPEQEGHGGLETRVEQVEVATDALAKDVFEQHLRIRQVERTCVAVHGPLVVPESGSQP